MQGSLTWAQFRQRGGLTVTIDPRPFDGAPTYVSNAPTRGSGIFPTWQRALDFIASQRDVAGGMLEILGPVTIPAGTWDLRGMQVIGAARGGTPTGPEVATRLAIGAGVQLTNCLGFNNCTIELAAGAGPVIDLAAASGTRVFVFDTCGIIMGANSEFIRVSGNNALALSLVRTLIAKTGTGQEFVNVTAAGSAGVLLQAQDSPTSVAADLFRTVGNNQLEVVADASAVIYGQPRALTTSGNVQVNRLAPVPWAPPAVIVAGQLGGAADRCFVRQATMLVASGANFTVGNTVSITDGTSTETWTAVAGAPGPAQFQVGLNLDESMDSLCSQIRTHSTLWTTAETVACPLQPSGCVIMRRTQDRPAYADRIFATATATLQVWNYARGPGFGTYAYPGDQAFPTLEAVPTADGGVGVFGWGDNNVTGGLVVGVLDNDPAAGTTYRANKILGSTGTWTSSQAYTPSSDVDWVDPNPTTIAEALDRIASAVYGILTGPIP